MCWQALNKRFCIGAHLPYPWGNYDFSFHQISIFICKNMTSLRWALYYFELCFYLLMFHEPKSWSLMVIKYRIKMCLIFYPILLIQNSFELKQTLSYKKLSCTFRNFDPNVLLPFYVHPSPTHHLNPHGVRMVVGSF